MHTHEPENGLQEVDTSKGYEQRDARVSGVVIFLVDLKMLGQFVDTLREQRDLHLRRTRI